MALADLQRALALLYTDAERRAAFFRDPEGTGSALGLDEAEVRQLAAMHPAQVQGFARSLQRKRLEEVVKLLPLTRQFLGDGFAARFIRFAEGYTPAGVGRHLHDAIAFARDLEAHARSGQVELHVAELARFEAVWLEMSGSTRRWAAAWFRYPVVRLAGAVARRETVPGPLRQTTVVLWVRPRRGGPVRQVTVALPRLFGAGKQADRRSVQ